MVESSYTIGVKKGVKQGLEKGIKQGIEQGMVKGEKQKAIEIAKKLIDVLDVKTIALKTGLSEKEIAILRQQHPN